MLTSATPPTGSQIIAGTVSNASRPRGVGYLRDNATLLYGAAILVHCVAYIYPEYYAGVWQGDEGGHDAGNTPGGGVPTTVVKPVYIDISAATSDAEALSSSNS